MRFTDNVKMSGVRKRADGYLVADARIARTGIQTYAGWEMGKPDMDFVKVYRPEEEVFNTDSMTSFAHRPVTDDHPDEEVTADNWLLYAKGQTDGNIARDGQFLRVPLMVADGATIKQIEEGKQEISAGYKADIDWTPGVTKDGEKYDAVQRNIRANHVAIVRRGRAGSQVRIGYGDAGEWGASPVTSTQDRESIVMADALRTVIVDGLSVSTTDQGAQAITKLQKDLENSTKLHADAIAAKDAEIKAKDEEIGTLKAEKKRLEDAAPTPEQLDKMVADRAELVTLVKTIDSKIDTNGKTDAELRRSVVVAKMGDALVKDASDAEINGMFKAIASSTNTYADKVKTGIQPNTASVKDEEAAYAKSIADLNAKDRKQEVA